MNAVSTSSSFCTSLKRVHSSSSSDVDLVKHQDSDSEVKRPRYYYVLASESSVADASDGVESVYSIQNHSTDWVKDTSDTCSKSSGDMLELDIVSMSDEDAYPFENKGSSSSPEDFHSRVTQIEISDDDSDSCGDLSGSVEESGEKSRHRKYKFKNCVQCGQFNRTPLYRYCDKCYKMRKNFFPPRPRKKKKDGKYDQTTNAGTGGNLAQCDSGVVLSPSGELSYPEMVAQFSSREQHHPSQECRTAAENLCATCLSRPKDGGYVHGKIVHVYSCYRCSSRIIKQIGRCPICNMRVRQVCKVIIRIRSCL